MSASAPSMEPEREEPVSPDAALPIARIEPGQAGFREIIEFGTDFGLVIGDVRHQADARLHRRARNALNFHFRLSGAGAIGVGAEAPFPVQRQTMALLLSPEDVEKIEEFYEGEHEQSVTIFCQPEFVARRFGDAGGRLPSALRACLDQPPEGPVFASAALSTQMSLAVRALIENEFQDTLRRVHAEAKALELMVLALAALAEAEARSGDHYLGPRDVQRVERVREALENQYLDPPTIAQLARDAGVNEAKLMHIFKQHIGETIFNFTQRLKMERAKALLETSDISVTEIAFEVGYEYSSNFTTAFRRHFGVTPRTAREAARR